jgi:hypothetical protein
MGSYVNGSFSALASMHLQRLYYATNVLANDHVFLIGGEYTGANQQRTLTTTAEMYNPITNKWVNLPSIQDATGQFGDAPSELLQTGQVLLGPKEESTSYLYNPKTKIYTQTGGKLRGDINDEETWTKLPDGSILSYDIWASIANGVGSAQRYVPSQGAWVDAGQLPVLLSTANNGHEMGPGLILPDGRVFEIGANGNTALYTPATNSWVAGPVIPGGYVADDAPGAILPNGHVIFTADQPVYNPPTALFDFDPAANTITQVTLPPTLAGELASSSAFVTRMLVLPTGQVLLNLGGSDLWAFTPDTGANPAWQPVIKSVSYTGNFAFMLKGQQLNGMSEGASYGDDAGMSENYPIVLLTDSTGHVYYARTYSWSSVGVQTGSALERTRFELPAGMPAGTYSLAVVASGIASNPMTVTITANEIPAISQGSAAGAAVVASVFDSHRATVQGKDSTPATGDRDLRPASSPLLADALSEAFGHGADGLASSLPSGTARDFGPLHDSQNSLEADVLSYEEAIDAAFAG